MWLKATTKTKRLDQTAISVVKASEEGWWVADIIYGRWGVEQTARKIFEAVRDYQTWLAVGNWERGVKERCIPISSQT